MLDLTEIGNYKYVSDRLDKKKWSLYEFVLAMEDKTHIEHLLQSTLSSHTPLSKDLSVRQFDGISIIYDKKRDFLFVHQDSISKFCELLSDQESKKIA